MKRIQLFGRTLLLASGFLFVQEGFAQDPNFHIYIGIGQSNMEGQGAISAADRVANNRFQILESVNCTNLGRTQGNWYPAVPPLTRCDTKLTIMDYFGRTLADSLPQQIKIGAIVVAVGDSKIELWDKVNYKTYLSTAPSWTQGWAANYANNPYGRMIEMAKIAQKTGVIKGILLHQGEANSYPPDPAWPGKVKAVYKTIIADLGLDSNAVPLLAGEVVNADQNGSCAGMNKVIDTLPRVLKQAYVISSAGVPDTTDNIHFSAVGLREFGKRYATKMLAILRTQTPIEPVKQIPFKDTLSIPGIVQAEDYDQGGQGASYSDTDGENQGGAYRADGVDIEGSVADGFVVGYVIAGEWLEYTVKVKTAGTLTYKARVASGAESSSFSMTLDSIPLTASIPVPNTGDWKTFTTVSGTTSALTTGIHVFRITADASYFNLDWIEFAEPSVSNASIKRFDIESNSKEYRIYNIQGSYLGDLSVSNGQEMENKLRTLSLQKGRYVIRSKMNDNDKRWIELR